MNDTRSTTGKFPLISLEEIIDAARPLNPPIRGIYFLIESGSVVYVGQSADCVKRIWQHLPEKKFDSFSIFAVPVGVPLDALETAHILKYTPKYNRRIDVGGDHIGVSHLKSLGITKWALKRWVREGKVTPVLLSERIYYARAEIEAAMEGEA